MIGQGVNGFKLKDFTLRVLKHRHRLPRQVVEVPSLEAFQVRLDRALSSLM